MPWLFWLVLSVVVVTILAAILFEMWAICSISGDESQRERDDFYAEHGYWPDW